MVGGRNREVSILVSDSYTKKYDYKKNFCRFFLCKFRGYDCDIGVWTNDGRVMVNKGDWVREANMANSAAQLHAWELMKQQRVYPWMRGTSQCPWRTALRRM